MKPFVLVWLILLSSASPSTQAYQLPNNLTPLRVDLEALQSPEGLQLERMPHKNAEWKTTPLAKHAGQHTANLEIKGVNLGRLHYYIRARVLLGQVTGWLSSPVYQL